MTRSEARRVTARCDLALPGDPCRQRRSGWADSQPDRSHRQLAAFGMQGGTEYGAVANAPTFGARTQLTTVLVAVAGSFAATRHCCERPRPRWRRRRPQPERRRRGSIWSWFSPRHVGSRTSSAPETKCGDRLELFHHARSLKRERFDRDRTRTALQAAIRRNGLPACRGLG